MDCGVNGCSWSLFQHVSAFHPSGPGFILIVASLNTSLWKQTFHRPVCGSDPQTGSGRDRRGCCTFVCVLLLSGRVQWSKPHPPVSSPTLYNYPRVFAQRGRLSVTATSIRDQRLDQTLFLLLLLQTGPCWLDKRTNKRTKKQTKNWGVCEITVIKTVKENIHEGH